MPRIVSYANVASTLALVLALSGTAYAAVTITGKEVKNESLTGKDVRNKSLTGKDVRDSSLTGGDIKDGSVAGADLLDSSVAGADVTDGSLGGADLQDGSVAGADLKDGSVAGADVADGSLAAADLAPGTLQLPGTTVVFAGGGGTIPGGANNTFTFQSELYDTGEMFTGPGNAVTIPRTGTYLLAGAISFDVDANIERQTRLVVNGAVKAISDMEGDISDQTVSITMTLRLAAGDQVTLGTFNSGAPVPIVNFGTGPGAWLSVQMVSP